MKTLGQYHIDKVKKELERGTCSYAIIDRYTVEWKVSARTIERAIRKASAVLNEERRDKQEIIKKVKGKYIELTAEENIKNVITIDKALMAIIDGTARCEQWVYTPEGRVSKEVAPTFADISRAAFAYFRLHGKQPIPK